MPQILSAWFAMDNRRTITSADVMKKENRKLHAGNGMLVRASTLF
jgi:hypothetical protein